MAAFRGMVVKAFGPPGVMKMDQLAPLVPSSSQVVIQMYAAGVNPVDTYIRKGEYGALPSLPFVPGKDGAGVIHALGDKVQGLKKGDRVYALSSVSGTYAEMALCEAAHVFRLNQKASFEQGAGIGIPYFTAYRALFLKGRAKKGETVLIHGASGGVGIACIQFAKNRGLQVIGTAGTSEGLKMILDQGADHALNHNDDSHFDEILKITEKKGVNLIIEMLANKNLGKDLAILAKNGRVAIVGNRGSVEINPRDLMAREAEIFGVMNFSSSQSEMEEIASAIDQGLSQGFLSPILSKVFPLENAPEAHEYVVPGDKPSSGATGKVVLKISHL